VLVMVVSVLVMVDVGNGGESRARPKFSRCSSELN
jgi:hypothetical protein